MNKFKVLSQTEVAVVGGGVNISSQQIKNYFSLMGHAVGIAAGGGVAIFTVLGSEGIIADGVLLLGIAMACGKAGRGVGDVIGNGVGYLARRAKLVKE